MLTSAQEDHLARFTFSSVNRDRRCGGGSDPDACGGISPKTWDFAKVIVEYNG